MTTFVPIHKNATLPGVSAVVERITPSIARAMLEKNTRNRTVSQHKVKQYAGAMARGEWRLNGEAIKFNESGTRVLDGQQRLLAVVASGTAQDFLVVRGLPDDAQETMDIGRARTFSDMLHLRGERVATHLAAATRIVWAYELSGMPVAGMTNPQPTHAQLFDTLARHPAIRDSYRAGGTTHAITTLTRSVVMGLHYLFSYADRDDADAFFTSLNDGEGLAAGDPIYTLRDRLLREALEHKRLTTTVKTVFTIRAFNAWRNGERIARLQWKPGGARPDRFPEIEGCTVPIFGGEQDPS